jgi:hypothetical protein
VAYVLAQFPDEERQAELHRLAILAARDAGVEHYWVACSCMNAPDDVG